MWTSVFMVKDSLGAADMRRLLRDNSIISCVRHSDEYYEILVPSCEVASAHSIIIDTKI